MTPNLTEDFKTVDEVESDLRGVLKQVRSTGRPVVVTVRGKPDAVILSAAEFERRLHNARVGELLAEGEAAITAKEMGCEKDFSG